MGYRNYYRNLFYTNAYFMGDLIINEAFGYLFEDMEEWMLDEWLQKYAMARVKLDMMPRDALYNDSGQVLAYVTKYDYLEDMGIFGEQPNKKGQRTASDNPSSDYYIDPNSGERTHMENSPIPHSGGTTFNIDPGLSNKMRD